MQLLINFHSTVIYLNFHKITKRIMYQKYVVIQRLETKVLDVNKVDKPKSSSQHMLTTSLDCNVHSAYSSSVSVPESSIVLDKKAQKQDLKNIKNVKRCRDGMPKSMRTR